MKASTLAQAIEAMRAMEKVGFMTDPRDFGSAQARLTYARCQLQTELDRIKAAEQEPA